MYRSCGGKKPRVRKKIKTEGLECDPKHQMEKKIRARSGWETLENLGERKKVEK
jgi:hypothetical protein